MKPVRIFIAILASSLSIVGAHADQRLRVVVRSSSGDAPVRDAYISLVPPYRPWSRPVAELIAREGVAVVDLPPGEYRVVAGAPGNGVAVKGPIVVSPDAPGQVEVRLPALQTVTGTVRDDQGHPLSGVTISDVNASIEPPLGRMSELARNHLAAAWKAISADDGTWSLTVPADSKNPLLAELAGHSIGWQPYDSGSAPVGFVLSAGARLRVRLDPVDPNVVISLLAQDKTNPVPAAWQGQFWARRAVAPLLEWESLAPGVYDVYAQQIDPRSFVKVTKLGSVTLEPGSARELAFELAAPSPVPREVASFFLSRMSRTTLQSLETFGRDATGLPRQVPHALEEVSGGTLIHLNTAAVRSPFYGYTGERYIAMSGDPEDPSERPRPAEALERASAGLHVRSGDPSLAMPAAGMAVFHQCGPMATVTFPVEVKKDGTVLFPAPAECLGLRLTFDPFGPLTWSRSLTPGVETEWLGDFTLYAGGTAGVHVVTQGGAPVADGSVGIQAKAITSGDALAIATNKTRADGWVYFENLPAGRELYAIATTAAGHRSPPQPFRVLPREQTLIDPIVVPLPATLVVKHALDADFLRAFPKSHIELLILDPENAVARQEQRREEVAGREDVEFKDVQPGPWRLTALIATGTTMQPVRFDSAIELEPGASKRLSVTFKPLVFHGRVSSRRKGLKGNIDIIGSQRSDIVPSIPTSESGEFTALLQRAGAYQVGVRTRDPFRVVWIGDVDFTDPARFVDVVVPDNEIVVTVRADGKRAGNIAVSAYMNRDGSGGMQTLETIPVATDANGQARLEGVLSGNWIVKAIDRDRNRSAETRVSVVDGKAMNVDLDLGSGVPISGSVRQAYGGPVPGARVACVVPRNDRPSEMLVTWSADDGTFAIDGNSSQGTALCSVTSFFGSEGYRVVPGVSSTLALPAKSATLQVLSLSSINRATSLWLVSEDGRLIDVSPYVQSSGSTAMLTVPALSPTRWKLVRVGSLVDWIALTSGSAAPLPPIADFTLEPGEKKTIDLVKGK